MIITGLPFLKLSSVTLACPLTGRGVVKEKEKEKEYHLFLFLFLFL